MTKVFHQWENGRILKQARGEIMKNTFSCITNIANEQEKLELLTQLATGKLEWKLFKKECAKRWGNISLFYSNYEKEAFILQASHRLEKYLNIQDCLEKSLKIKFALKSTWKTLRGIEKSLNFTIYRRIQQCFGDISQYKIVVPLFGAAATNKDTTILYLLS